MKKVIIVGAGIAGLSAGIYAKQSGFNVTIFESHTIPGGASTSWRRKGYLFEGGMHWLTGSSPKVPLNKVWRELGALRDDIPIYNKDPFFTVEFEGKTAYLYRDVEKLRQHFLEISPEDKNEIDQLCRDIKRFSKVSMPISDIKNVKVKKKSSLPLSAVIKMLPAFSRRAFYANQTAGEYASRFKSPILRLLIKSIVGEQYSATGMIFTIATLASGDGGYPEGGSLAMASRMAKYFESLGGKINYNSKVTKISVNNGISDGVIINGKHIPADAVIVTQDTLVAIDSLFDPPINEPWAQKMRQSTKPMLNTFICLGIETDLSELPESMNFVPYKPLSCGEAELEVVSINNYAGYKGYAPDGCTAVTSIISGDSYDYWKACKENNTYELEKKRLAESFIETLAERFPKIRGKVAVWDVATPLTYERYLGSYKGSWMSVMCPGENMKSYPSKPENFQNIYFAGQRLNPPGGLPVAAETGRKAVQYLCRDTDTIFQGNI
ncbi:amine oxidase [Clostridiales bacterium oral taxon 876 str. F0540]|nr:amine oxidase [Clostridiales bacterium oral taxon 876 str. F0540]